MGYLEGSKVGYEQTVNPFAVVLDEVNKGYERRRAEDAKRQEEDYKLKQLFAKMKKQQDDAIELQKMKGEQDIEKVYAEKFNTPMAAIGQAQQPAMSLSGGGVGDVQGKPVDMAQGVVRQAGLSPRTVKSPKGVEYEISDEVPMTAAERNYKRKQQKEFTEEYADAQNNLRFINEAEPLIDTLPKGLGGKIQSSWMKNFDADNPILGNWQKIKAILTDTTLLQSMKTKGAISDKEMEEFKQAAANDSLISGPRIKSAFERYKRILETESKSKVDSYFKQFGEDPRDGGLDNGGGNIDDEYENYLKTIGSQNAPY